MMNPIHTKILQEGLDDWIPLAAVDGLVRRCGAESDQEARELGVAAIHDLTSQGLVTLGDVTTSGFHEWNLPLEIAMSRIEDSWKNLDRNQWGFFCWLKNTEQGDQHARLLVEQ